MPAAAKSGSGPRRARKSKRAERPIPVTLLSGFLGSGKTSLMKHILLNKEGLRVAVIMNEISEVNIDVMALEGSKLLKSEEKVVEMANGCICCTLREDLLLQLRELARSGNFDAVLIESSGIAEPMQVAETFFVNTNDGNVELQLEAPLDNCVTVIDASMMRRHMESLDGIEAIDPSADTSGESGATDIAGLLFSQLEFANVVLLNKVDLLPGKDAAQRQQRVEELVALVKRINPHAQVLPTEHSKVPLSAILRTRNFSLEFAEKIDNWMEDIKSGIKHVPETLEYGVSSFYFTSDRPFHPQRLHDWFDKYFLLKQVVAVDPADVMTGDEEEEEEEEEEEDEEDDDVDAASNRSVEGTEFDDRAVDAEEGDEPEFEERQRRRERYGNLFRSKGFVWIGGAERAKHLAQWSQAGSILTLQHCGILDGSAPPGQKLVFIGQNLERGALEEDLQQLLLTDDELAAMRRDMAEGRDSAFPDPLEPFPSGGVHEHDHSDEAHAEGEEDDEEEEGEDEDEEEEEEEEDEEEEKKKGLKRSEAPLAKRKRRNTGA